MRENGPLMACWSQETRARLVMEFIREYRLFSQLNAFLKKRRR